MLLSNNINEKLIILNENKESNQSKTAFKTYDKSADKNNSTDNIDKNKLEDILNEYDSGLQTDGKQDQQAISYQCLMELEGCEREFKSKREMYMHLVTECDFFVCRLCNERCKADETREDIKRSLNKSLSSSNKIRLKNLNKNEIKDELITFDQESIKVEIPIILQSKYYIQTSELFSIYNIKQVSFFNNKRIVLNHNQNLFPKIISFDEYELEQQNLNSQLINKTLLENKQIRMNKFCFNNFINIPFEDKNYLNSPIKAPKLFSQNKLNFVKTAQKPSKQIGKDENSLFIGSPNITQKKKYSSKSGFFNFQESAENNLTNENELKHNMSNSSKSNESSITSEGGKIVNNSRKNDNNGTIVSLCSKKTKKSTVQKGVSDILDVKQFRKFNPSNIKLNLSSKKAIKFKLISKSSCRFSKKQEFNSKSAILSMDIILSAGLVIIGSEDCTLSVYNLYQESRRRFSNFNSIIKSSVEHQDDIIIVKVLNKHSAPKLNIETNEILFKYTIISIDKRNILINWNLEVNVDADSKKMTNFLLKKLFIYRELIPSNSLHFTPLIKSCCSISNHGKKADEIEKHTIIVGLTNGDLYNINFNKDEKNKYTHDYTKYTHFKNTVFDILYMPEMKMIITASYDYKSPVTFWSLKSKPISITGLYIEQIMEEDKLMANMLCLMTDSSFAALYDNNIIKIFCCKTMKYHTLITYSSRIMKSKILSITKSLNFKNDNQIIVGYDNKEMVLINIDDVPDIDHPNIIELNSESHVNKIFDLRTKPCLVFIYKELERIVYVIMETGSNFFMKYYDMKQII